MVHVEVLSALPTSVVDSIVEDAVSIIGWNVLSVITVNDTRVYTCGQLNRRTGGMASRLHELIECGLRYETSTSIQGTTASYRSVSAPTVLVKSMMTFVPVQPHDLLRLPTPPLPFAQDRVVISPDSASGVSIMLESSGSQVEDTITANDSPSGELRHSSPSIHSPTN